MSDEKVLSQEEVDALTAGVDDGSVETETDKPQGSFEALDFASQERIVTTQFPVLTRIYERFANRLTESIYAMLDMEPTIELHGPENMKYGEFIAERAMPSAIAIVRFNPLRGKAQFVMDSTLINVLVESYFGGHIDSVEAMDERELTMTEQGVVKTIYNKIFSDYEEVWKPVLQPSIEKLGMEYNPQLANGAPAEDVMVTAKFSFTRDDKDIGNLFVLMPYIMLEPIREQLDLGAARADDEIDPNWIVSLREEILDAPLEISAKLTDTDLLLRQVVNMKVGDVIRVEMPDIITMNIVDVPSFRGKYGISNDKCAIKITERVKR